MRYASKFHVFLLCCCVACLFSCAESDTRSVHVVDLVAETPIGQIVLKGKVDGKSHTDAGLKMPDPQIAGGLLGFILGPGGAAGGMLLTAVLSHFVGAKRGAAKERRSKSDKKESPAT